MRWPSMSSCVKPPPSPRRRGGPPRPGAPGVVTPGRRRSTSPTVASPNLSISSRPITILAAVDWRRCSVSDSRPPVISTCWPLEGSGAGAGAGGGTSETGGADAAAAGAEAVALGSAEGADAGPAAAWPAPPRRRTPGPGRADCAWRRRVASRHCRCGLARPLRLNAAEPRGAARALAPGQPRGRRGRLSCPGACGRCSTAGAAVGWAGRTGATRRPDPTRTGA